MPKPMMVKETPLAAATAEGRGSGSGEGRSVRRCGGSGSSDDSGSGRSSSSGRSGSGSAVGLWNSGRDWSKGESWIIGRHCHGSDGWAVEALAGMEPADQECRPGTMIPEL